MKFHNSNTAVMTKAEARALAAFASKDTTRQHLNSVCLDFANGCAVATDGYRLVKVEVGKMGDDKPCLIPLDAFERAVKLCKPKHGILVTRNGQAVTLEVIDPGNIPLDVFGSPDEPERAQFVTSTINCKSPDAAFPPYEQVVPKLSRNEVFNAWGINAKYLGDLSLVTEAVGSRHHGVKVHPGGELGPILFLTENWIAAIMPMRI